MKTRLAEVILLAGGAAGLMAGGAIAGRIAPGLGQIAAQNAPGGAPAAQKDQHRSGGPEAEGKAEKAATEAVQRPKIRAITAFVHLDRLEYQREMGAAVAFLKQAKAAYEGAGYEVETLRVATQPFPEYTGDLTGQLKVDWLKELDQYAGAQGILVSIGPAMQSDSDDPREAQLLARGLAETQNLSGSIVIAQGDEIYARALRASTGVIEYLEEHTPASQGNFRFAALAMVKSGTPFFPAAYYSGVGSEFAVGLESANVVEEAFSGAHNLPEARQRLETLLGTQAGRVDELGSALAKKSPEWIWGGIDLSPAPLGKVSIGKAIEELTGAPVGSSGTLTAAALITHALRAIHVAHPGYSGLMLPVLEDEVLAQRWSEGVLTTEGLLAFSSVCGTGLDTVPLPGTVTREQLERILRDVATLAIQKNKPLSARLLPVAGKSAGQRTEFTGPYLTNTTLHAVF
jgi:uncharacterized protein